MSLPIYQNITLKYYSFDDITMILKPDLNLRHPVVFNLKTLSLEDQREVIGLIENFFDSESISYKFPYPVYIVSDHEKSITQIPLISEQAFLPQFYAEKEGKMNVKESHIVGKNKLLQQEVSNKNSKDAAKEMFVYGSIHRQIFEQENEMNFYQKTLDRLTKKGSHG
jgi:hypothetical protein